MADRNVMVRLRANADQFNREMRRARESVGDVRREIDTTNDRTAWLAQGFLALAPALVPLGAAAVPILAGIATQATIGVGAIGTIALAFSGVGDALKALNEYQLEPTAENFEALQLEMEKMGPSGAEFVRFLDDVGGKLNVLKMDARDGMFPGMTEGIESALDLLPRLREIVTEIARGIGELSADAGAGIAGPEFEAFFEYLRTDAKDILVDMGKILGNFVDGFASMIVAFGPLTADYSDGFLEMSRSFEEWAEGLSDSSSFQDFVNYIRSAGPQAAEFLISVSGALIQLVEAAAPVGSIALPLLSKFFDIVAALADTPLGSLAIMTAAITSMYGRIVALKTITTGGVLGPMTKGFRESGTAAKAAIPSIGQFGLALGSAARSQAQLKDNIMKGGTAYALASAKASSAKMAVADFAKAAAPAAVSGGLLALSMTGIADSAGFGNAALGGMIGLMTTGGPWGAAIGFTIGAISDAIAKNQDWTASIEAANTAIENQDLAGMSAALKKLKDDLDFREAETDFTSFGSVFSNIGSDIADTFAGDWLGTEHMDKDREKIESLRREMEYIKGVTGGGWDTSGMELYTDALGLTGDKADEAASDIRRFTAAVENSLGILDKQADFDAFEAAIDDARKGFKEFGDTLDSNTNAGRTNRDNLREIARTALTASENLHGMARVDYLRDTSKQFVDMARKLGMGEKAAQRWADRLFMLDDLKVSPTVRMEDKEGRAKVRRMMAELGLLDNTMAYPGVNLLYQRFLRGKISVEDMMGVLNGLKASPSVSLDDAALRAGVANSHQLMAGLDGDHADTYIYTHHVNVGQPRAPHAGGGLIRGPGGPLDDIVPVAASNGEYMIRAAAVQRYGIAMFDRYNSMAVPAESAGMSALTWANRAGGGVIGSSRPSGGWGDGGTQHIIVEVRGEMDLRRAKAQIHELARGASGVEYEQRERFAESQRD